MSVRIPNPNADPAALDDAETVAALVQMLSGMGIRRTRIDAMISKASRPCETPQDGAPVGPANRNVARTASRRVTRSA